MSAKRPAAERPLLEVDDLRAGFGASAVLHGVDLAVRQGEIHAVLGLNGAGKSVTMKVVGGVVPAWSGSVVLDGVDVTGRSIEERVALGMGHVPQGRQLFPDLTVEENLRLGAYLLRRRDRSTYAERLHELYERFPRLSERRSQHAGSLSGGERAMLAVARALVNDPALLLIDEPSAGLAPVTAHEVLDLLRQVNADGVTMLLIEQNVALALRIADRISVLQRGVVVYESTTDRIDHRRLNEFLGIGRLLSASTRGDRAGRSNGAPRSRSGARRRTRSR